MRRRRGERKERVKDGGRKERYPLQMIKEIIALVFIPT